MCSWGPIGQPVQPASRSQAATCCPNRKQWCSASLLGCGRQHAPSCGEGGTHEAHKGTWHHAGAVLAGSQARHERQPGVQAATATSISSAAPAMPATMQARRRPQAQQPARAAVPDTGGMIADPATSSRSLAMFQHPDKQQVCVDSLEQYTHRTSGLFGYQQALPLPYLHPTG
jgi:hypothetical protein